MREESPLVVTAGIYCRISLATIGDTTKTDDQARICRELAARLGWEVADVYTDNARSAWQRNRKRPQWDRMLADVDAGRINAIIVYHGDRLVRQPWDLEKLLDLAHAKGVRLASPSGVRDLDNPDDQFILGIEANMARRESANTSRRKKAQYERMRRQGLTRPGGKGGRAFGFESDGVTHRPDEAAIVREAAAAILSGRSPRSVLGELTARGVRSTAGMEMGQSSFLRMLTMPRQAGLMPDGESAAAWEPVLDRATWEALRLMAGGHPQVGRKGVPQYLLSGIPRCGRCGHKMWAAQRSPVRLIYRCPPDGGCGNVSRRRDLLEAFVTGAVVERLRLEANPASQAPQAPGLAAEFAALTDQRAEIEELLRDHTKGRADLLMARLDSLDARLERLRELSAANSAALLRRKYAGISREEFEAEPLAVRRSLVMACVDIVVLPSSGKGPGFRVQDVRVTPRQV